MSASSYKAWSAARPSTDAAARRVMSALVGVERPGSLYKALQRLGSTGAWLRRNQLAPLAWWRWRGSSDCPLGVALDLQTAWYAAVGDTELHCRELSEVLQVLAAHDVIPVVFKGAALAHSVYLDPACRLMGDLDLWVTAAEMDLAQRALETVGYQYKPKPDRPPAIMELFMGERQMVGTRTGAGLVELHFGVFAGEWLRRTASVDEAAIRNRAQPVMLLGQRAHQLTPEDALIQLAAHTAVNHQMSSSALRSLVDITLLARHSPVDWAVVIQRARAWRVATATWLMLRLAVDLCGLTEAAEAVRQLAPSKLRRKLLGLFANAEALVEMHDLSKSKWRYVYLLLMVDRKRDAVKLVYRALWPEDEWLQARYGQGGAARGARLRHVFDAARGKI